MTTSSDFLASFERAILRLAERVFCEETDDFFQLIKRSKLSPSRDFVGGDFQEVSSERSSCVGFSFKGCNFSRGKFYEVDFISVDFSNCDLSGVEFSGCSFFGCKLRGVEAPFSAFRNCVMSGIDLSNGNFSSSVIKESSIAPRSMDHVFRNISFEERRFIIKHKKLLDSYSQGVALARSSNFNRADLSKSVYSHMSFSNASFSGANISGSDFSEAVDLSSNIVHHVKMTKETRLPFDRQKERAFDIV